MRARLTTMLATTASVVLLMAAAADVQVPPGTGSESGSDSSASGSLLDAGTAEAVVETGGTPGWGGGGAQGGSGGGSAITCTLGWPSGPNGAATGATPDALLTVYESQRGPVPVIQTCVDDTGAILSNATILWEPSESGPVASVEPQVLAEMARERMSWPAPVVATSPPLDHGTYAQLSTFFHVSNWQPVTSPPARAGDVWATVTATPVSQSWVIQDTYRGTSETVTCDGPGALYDRSRPYEAQVPAPCGWTPRHSSDGQTQTSQHTGEPCFPAIVTLTWTVSWQSNIVPGGVLGEGTSTSSVCLVVAELQATVVESPGA